MIKLNGGSLPEKKKPKKEAEADDDKPSPPPPPPPPPPEVTINELSQQSVFDGCLEIEVVPAEIPDPSYVEPEDWDPEEDGK